jgi:hypothetical protein
MPMTSHFTPARSGETGAVSAGATGGRPADAPPVGRWEPACQNVELLRVG